MLVEEPEGEDLLRRVGEIPAKGTVSAPHCPPELSCLLRTVTRDSEALLTLQQEALLGQRHRFTACEVQRPVGGSPGAEP